jgi:type I restriction enzyme, S subunit
MLKTGDVLLVQSGHIGHSAVVSEEHDGHNCHAMIVISCHKEMIIGEFLSLLCNSFSMRKEFEKIRSGSTVPHLTCREVKELSVELPGLARQRRILDQIQELRVETERLEMIYRSKLLYLGQLKQSMLRKAFSGELTAHPEKALPEAAE